MLRLFALGTLAACGDPQTVEVAPSVIENGFTLSAPVGEVDDYAEFVWEFDLPPGGEFDVALYDFSSGAPTGPLRRSLKLELPLWEPHPSITGLWPDRILWRVFAYDANGALLGKAEATASR